MPEQIEIDIRANASQARQAVEQLTEDIGRLKRAQITGVPGTPPMLFGASGQRYIQDPTSGKLLKYTQELKEAEKELGNEIEETGHKSAGMVGRMIAMGLAFKAVEASAKTLTAVFAEPMALEKAQNQFRALTAHTADYTKELKIAAEVARATGTDLTTVYGQVLRLQDAGIQADQLRQVLTNIDEAAKNTGVSAEHITDVFARVKLGEGTISQMRELAHLTGQWKDESLELVQAYENLTRTLPIIEKSMDAVTRATKQMADDMERSRGRGEEFLKQTGITPGIQAQLPRLAALPANLSVEWLRATGLLHLPQMPLGTSQIVLNQVKTMIADYRVGLAAIQQQEGLSPQAMRTLGPTLPIEYVMRAAKAAREDDLRAQERGAQAQKEHNQLRLETAKIDVGADLAGNMEKANVQATQFVVQSQTISGWWDKTNAAIKDAYQHGAGIQALTGLLTLGQFGQVPWARGGGFQGGSASIIDQLKAALGITAGGQAGQPQIKEINSDKIESHLAKLVEVFSTT